MLSLHAYISPLYEILVNKLQVLEAIHWQNISLQATSPSQRHISTGIKQGQRVGRGATSPGAVAVGGDGAETPAVCCVPPGCACVPPAGPCAGAAAWPRRPDRPRRRGQKRRLTPSGLRWGPHAGCAAPSTGHTPSAESWEARTCNMQRLSHPSSQLQMQ